MQLCSKTLERNTLQDLRKIFHFSSISVIGQAFQAFQVIIKSIYSLLVAKKKKKLKNFIVLYYQLILRLDFLLLQILKNYNFKDYSFSQILKNI